MLDTIGKFERIGIVFAGPIDAKRGIILNPPNIDVRNLRIVKLLEGRYKVPVSLLNDCIGGALGEKIFGAGKKAENFVYLTLSTGIGCGVVANNRLLFGKDGNAHEVGHLVVDAESKLICGCGGAGHWEAYCGGKNVGNFARHLLNTEFRGERTKLNSHGPITSKQLFVTANTDNIANKIVERVCKINAIQIANIINAYDPELIIIGGPIALENSQKIMAAINKYTGKYTINRLPKIKITPLGEKVCLYGAIALAAQGGDL
jgi:glucokinase